MSDRHFLVTESQLMELQMLVWGARMTKPGEPERFNALISAIRRAECVGSRY